MMLSIARLAKVIVELTDLWFSLPQRTAILEFEDAKNQKPQKQKRMSNKFIKNNFF